MTRSNIRMQTALTSSMMKKRRRWFCSFLLATGTLFFNATLLAQDATQKPPKVGQVIIPESFEGDEDFEEACRLRLSVDSIETLKEIIGLGESALKKGLDKVDTEAAKKMIAACYVQKTKESIGSLGGKQLSKARANKLMGEFLEDLGQAITYDPTLIDAYLMKAEILARRDQRDEAYEVADQGIERLLPESKKVDQETRAKLSKLLMMRAGMRKNAEELVSDLKLSVQTDPNNVASITILRNNLIQSEKTQEAADFFRSVLDSSPENELLICSAAELLAADPSKIMDALQLLGEKIKVLPKSSALLKSRAKIHSVNKSPDLAKADMDRALELSDVDVDGLLMRAKILLQSDDIEQARKDVDAALELDGNRADAVLLRSAIAAEQKRFGDAINDLLLIIKAQPKDAPKDAGLLMQLGLLYSQDNRPTQAIEVFGQAIKVNEEAWEAYRLRGDTRLSVGDHANAIADFEKALKLLSNDDEDRSGILNNLSWVLSTSPTDTIRDGKRALEYAVEACKLTNYEKPHILSTLAAAHAELGDFEKAIEWSKKGVDIARVQKEPQLEQLESELKSYQEKKPWREKTETKENKAPIAGRDTGVDT